LTKKLNAIWRETGPHSLTVSRSAGGGARIEHRGALLLEVLPGDASGGDAYDLARGWTASLERILATGDHDSAASR
jgi:hypothetical protein